MAERTGSSLEQTPVGTDVKLSLLWASLMFLFVYNDYFSLFTPGTVDMMQEGRMGPLGPATDGVLIGVSVLMAVPALMVFLSVGLPAAVSRWANVVLGVVYGGIQVLTLFGSPPFYQMVVIVEIVLCSLIAWSAFRWPRRAVTT
jgi:hypothetical protein